MRTGKLAGGGILAAVILLTLLTMAVQYLGIAIGACIVGAALYLDHRHKKGADFPPWVTKKVLALCAVGGFELIYISCTMIS